MKKQTRKKTKKVSVRSRFSSVQLMLFAIVFAVAGGTLIWTSLAAPPNKTIAGPLTLVSETQEWNPNISNHTCQTEDATHLRQYSGSLNGSFSVTEKLCNYNTDGYTSGGIGLMADVSVVGTLSDMTITSPTGVAHHAVLTSSSTFKHVTTNNYSVCFVPPYYVSTDQGSDPLSQTYNGNPWTYSLSGNISKASLTIYSQMTDVTVQKNYCPASQRNLL